MTDFDFEERERIARERRRATRYDTELDVSIITRNRTYAGQLLNVSQGGVFVLAREELAVRLGSMMTLQFAFAPGVEVEVSGQIKWIRKPPSATSGFGYGLEFLALGRAEREVIAAFIRARETGAETAVGSDRPAVFEVRTNNNSALFVRVEGTFVAAKARDLCREVSEKLALQNRRELLLYIAAQRYAPCPQESLFAFRRLFIELSHFSPAGNTAGIIVAPTTVAFLQLRHLVRESGLSDVLVHCEDDDEAATMLDADERLRPLWRLVKKL